MDAKKILYALLIAGLVCALSECSQTQAQVQYSLNLHRVTWDRSTISVLITPPNNESWWAPSYLNATLRAISQWNHAILDFASNYTDYAYLSKLRMTPTVAYRMDSGFDVYISWIEKPPSATDEIGSANILYELSSGIIMNSTIDLASKTLQGYVLNEVDMQNIALHELGHSLGLGHSNYTKDVMYPKYTPNFLDEVQALSTLDLYGVSTVFQWMSNSFSFPHSPQQSSVSLPSSIAYQYLQISYEDLPPTSPSLSPWQTLLTGIQNLINNVMSLIMRPEFLILIVVAAVALLVVAFILARQRALQLNNRT
jgi:predicted Zn-dependent protease